MKSEYIFERTPLSIYKEENVLTINNNIKFKLLCQYTC